MIRFLLLFAILSTALIGSASAQSPGPADPVQAIVRSSLGEFRAAGSPGCGASVLMGGETVAIDAAGLASLEFVEPLKPTTPLYGGSIGKQFIATIAFLLEARGRLDLNAPVVTLVPELSPGFAELEGRHLLTHSSGLRDYLQAAHHAGAGLYDPIESGSILQLLSRQKEPDYPPGNEVSYSNSNYFVLRLMIERATGEPFTDVARRLIFEPLGMASTAFLTDALEVVPGRARGYSQSADGSYHLHEPVVGSDGLLTTLEDLRMWALHLRTLEQTGDPLFERLTSPAILPDSTVTREAAGLRVDTRFHRRVIEHSGSNRGFRAYLGWYPDEDTFITVMCNVRQSGPTATANAIAAQIFGEERPARPVYPKLGPGGLALLSPLAGVFRAEAPHGALEIEVDGPYALVTLYGDDPSESRTATRVLGPTGDPHEFSLFGLEDSTLRIRSDTPEATLALVSAGQERAVYQRAENADSADFRALQGKFRSEYLKVSYDLSLAEGQEALNLAIERPDGRRIERGLLVPITRDFYILENDPETSVRLIRSDDGHVSGFKLTEPRLRSVVFFRSPPS